MPGFTENNNVATTKKKTPISLRTIDPDVFLLYLNNTEDALEDANNFKHAEEVRRFIEAIRENPDAFSFLTVKGDQSVFQRLLKASNIPFKEVDYQVKTEDTDGER